MASVNSKAVFEAYNAALLAAVNSDGDWLKFLETSATIGPASTRRFSFMNQVWLMIQGSGGYTATYNGWKAVGRNVVKGAKAVTVLKPIIIKEKDAAGNVRLNANGEPITRLVGFSTMNQFKVEDTIDLKTGERGYTAPPPPVDVTHDFEAWKHLIPAFESDFKVRINFVDDIGGGVNGYFQRSDRSITVKTGGRSSGAVFRTLCHELAHSELHADAEHNERSVQEMEAESVAAVVSRALGMPTDSYSFKYVSVWAGENPEGLDKKIKASGQAITKAADKILDIVVPEKPVGVDAA